MCKVISIAKTKLLITICMFLMILSCKKVTDCSQIITKIQKEFEEGNLSIVIHLADSVRKGCPDNFTLTDRADSLADIAKRIMIDFSLTEEQVRDQIEKRGGSFSDSEKVLWKNRGWLEWKLIDGKKMYFKRAATNLLLLRKFYEDHDSWLRETAEDPGMMNRLKHTENAFKLSDGSNRPVVPVNIAITYTITVHPDAVPEGEKIRCWMPWPKSNHIRQGKAELTGTSSREYIIAPDTAIHSTIFMEESAKKGVPTVFRISFRYQSSAQYFRMSGLKILPYKTSSDNYIKYTSQQPPQISFPENIRRLTDSITAPGDSPDVVVRKIYYWFKENICWTGALEYSISADIPQYVFHNRRGDCGMQTFLFMSMVRYKGIPVRWQSGWMVPPGAGNLHDWCEVYYEGTGWVPVDISYDLQQSPINEVRDYYLSGIDSYRLILNDGVAGPLHPGKLFYRSEPYDFQRGEVEWRGGNLYFDKWDYNIKIEYLK